MTPSTPASTLTADVLQLLRDARVHLPIAAASWNESDDRQTADYHVKSVLELVGKIDAALTLSEPVEATDIIPGGIGRYGDADHAAWLADKIVALGDYAKEAAQMLRRWPAATPPAIPDEAAHTELGARAYRAAFDAGRRSAIPVSPPEAAASVQGPRISILDTDAYVEERIAAEVQAARATPVVQGEPSPDRKLIDIVLGMLDAPKGANVVSEVANLIANRDELQAKADDYDRLAGIARNRRMVLEEIATLRNLTATDKQFWQALQRLAQKAVKDYSFRGYDGEDDDATPVVQGEPTIKYVPINTTEYKRYPNDKTKSRPECNQALDDRGDNEGQGLDPYWKWGFREGFEAAWTEPVVQGEPVAVRDVFAMAQAFPVQVPNYALATRGPIGAVEPAGASGAAQDAKDAARYRMIRNIRGGFEVSKDRALFWNEGLDAMADAAIDEAVEAQQRGSGT